MTVSERWSWGRILSSGTRPVNFAVESPISVGSGRYFFKWTADFETRRKKWWWWWWGGVRKRNSTASDNCPAAFPSPERVLSGGSACSRRSPAPARAAPPLFGAPTFAGDPPTAGRPPACAARPPGLCLRRRAPALALPTFPGVQPVIRSPISWWILLKRPRSRSRTKAIVFISFFGFRVLTGMSLPIYC